MWTCLIGKKIPNCNSGFFIFLSSLSVEAENVCDWIFMNLFLDVKNTSDHFNCNLEVTLKTT